MEDILLNKLKIYSDKDKYELVFNINKKRLTKIFDYTKAVVIDKNVWKLYKNELDINQDKLIFVDPVEKKKRTKPSFRNL